MLTFVCPYKDISNSKIACVADVSFLFIFQTERNTRESKLARAWGEQTMERSGEGVSKKGERAEHSHLVLAGYVPFTCF